MIAWKTKRLEAEPLKSRPPRSGIQLWLGPCCLQKAFERGINYLDWGIMRTTTKVYSVVEGADIAMTLPNYR